MTNKGGQTEALRLPKDVIDGNPWDDIAPEETNINKGGTNVAGNELAFEDPAPEAFNQPKDISESELRRIKRIERKFSIAALIGYNQKAA